jgi:arsenate reductase
MMPEKVYNVLFLGTCNSARNIMAEKILEYWCQGKFKAFSAGTHPNSTANPFAIQTLKSCDLSVEGLRSKSWHEFAAASSPNLDFVFAVCENAANVAFPNWSSLPVIANWGLKDPAQVDGTEEVKHEAFRMASNILQSRIKLLLQCHSI